ncbi:hypothetical protein TbgDal_III1640 [Trypanosoma brucei gambiense DAL972]|uniref:Uncharacterized protein n=1 Tax=Trypanosoma brucei gambiense (strain MHOM/CI/86/DAL972) TaxID=679716 RepID=C9ZK61_TRYB9|nr:hypothetical protein TbgDal_III1640 [Trypanosoma brucei gambiense DAL972]CBH09825.1 hypothetical protein TbgDal_III1640 [Trypanosoma brucei gambiense DAL972]|eukprot:XP_011772118.1 hypothetical protein TbgDal_III1640 [Trypanosoma brucei gambiense DAL972]
MCVCVCFIYFSCSRMHKYALYGPVFFHTVLFLFIFIIFIFIFFRSPSSSFLFPLPFPSSPVHMSKRSELRALVPFAPCEQAYVRFPTFLSWCSACMIFSFYSGGNEVRRVYLSFFVFFSHQTVAFPSLCPAGMFSLFLVLFFVPTLVIAFLRPYNSYRRNLSFCVFSMHSFRESR